MTSGRQRRWPRKGDLITLLSAWSQFGLDVGAVGMVLRVRKTDFTINSRFVDVLISGQRASLFMSKADYEIVTPTPSQSDD